MNANWLIGLRCATNVLVISGFASLVLASAHAADTEDNAASVDYQEIDAAARAFLDAQDQAFMDQDTQAMSEYIADDFEGWSIKPDGPKIRTKGHDMTVKMLEGFFRSGIWLESEVQPLGMVGNMLVQVETDVVNSANGPLTTRTLNVYVFKDGKRWRNWKFYPADEWEVE